MPITTTLITSVQAAAVRAAGVVDPTPVQPPGTDRLSTLFNWGVWIAMFILSASLLWGIVTVGSSLRAGGEVEGVKRVVLSGVGLVLVSSFGLVLGAFS